MKRILALLLLLAVLCWRPAVPVTATVGSNFPEHGYIVKIKTDRGQVPPSARRIGRSIAKRENIRVVKSEAELEELKAVATIEYIEENAEYVPFSSYDFSPEQWYLEMLKADEAWTLGCFGNEVRVGVIDSGVSLHPELAGTVLAGHNYMNDSSDTQDDASSHGTFISGLITAQTRGIAPNAKIVPLKIMNQGTPTLTDMIISAVYGAVDDFHCDVINMSIGNPAISYALRDACIYAYDSGAILVAAVGNYGTTAIYYPAGFTSVIGVGAVNADKSALPESQRNATVFVTAPGGMMHGLDSNGSHKYAFGTSLSAALVSGLAAIVKCADAGIDTEGMMQLLKVSVEDLGAPGYDTTFGYGLVDTELLMKNILAEKDIFVSPISVTAPGEVSATIYNNTSQTVTCTSIFTANANGAIIDTQQFAPVYLSPFESILVSYTIPASGKMIRHFLWESTSSMIPLAPVRDFDGT